MTEPGPRLGSIQATALVYRGQGLLLRGPSGSGKSLLALHAINQADEVEQTLLISDDLVHIHQTGDQLVLVAPDANRDQIELRFAGIVSCPHIDQFSLDLVVDFTDDAPRLPLPNDLVTTLFDQPVNRCPLPHHPSLALEHQMLIIRHHLNRI